GVEQRLRRKIAGLHPAIAGGPEPMPFRADDGLVAGAQGQNLFGGVNRRHEDWFIRQFSRWNVLGEHTIPDSDRLDRDRTTLSPNGSAGGEATGGYCEREKRSAPAFDLVDDDYLRLRPGWRGISKVVPPLPPVPRVRRRVGLRDSGQNTDG